MYYKDDPGLGDDIPCSECGAIALDTGLECTECGHDMRPEIYPEFKNKIKYYACLAAGAMDAHPLGYTLTWNGSDTFDPLDDKYVPYLDPNFGFHLKIGSGGFEIHFGNGALDTRIKFRVEPHGMEWITHLDSNPNIIGQGTFYESFYRCLISSVFGDIHEGKF